MKKINLKNYDLIILNTSGGKDSQTTIDVMVNMAIDQGYPLENMIAVHADLKRVEWKGSKEIAELQAKHYGLRFEWITRELGDLLDQVIDRGMWPSSTTRYCTSDQKRDQIQKVIVREGRDKAVDGKVRVLNCMGIRAEESSARAKKKPFENNKRASTKARTVDNYFPIFHWTESQVWDRIHKTGVPYHRAYDLGMRRLSCVFCVFASKDDLLIAGRHNYELLKQYVQIEKDIDHTFRKDFTIASILEEIEAELKAVA